MTRWFDRRAIRMLVLVGCLASSGGEPAGAKPATVAVANPEAPGGGRALPEQAFFRPALDHGSEPATPGEPESGSHVESSYAGEEGRRIKALSDPEVRGLLSGAGAGMAMAAELNHYPGPRHVLDLAEQLRLTSDQREATQALFEAMHAAAVRLGTALVDKERLLDARFATGSISESEVDRLTAQIARLAGSLRAVHLRAHVEQKAILTPRQIARYDLLRGYHRSGHEGHHASAH